MSTGSDAADVKASIPYQKRTIFGVSDTLQIMD
jgi:hypothetical protein